MYDTGKILAFIGAFVVFVSTPFWSNFGKAAFEPHPKLPTQYKECVESKEFMRADHMKLLRLWRYDVVRKEQRIYVNSKGETYPISLQNECMRCHTSKKEFCDQCHNYVAAHPYCWNCHISPEERKGWASKESLKKVSTEEASSELPASHH